MNTTLNLVRSVIFYFGNGTNPGFAPAGMGDRAVFIIIDKYV